MEKKKNGYFKAVSIISLVSAIILSVLLIFVLGAALTDFQTFMESFEQVVIAETGGIPGSGEEILLDAQSSAIVMLVFFSIMIGGGATVCFLAYFKIKKYSELTNEEANIYNGRILAWVVVMFVCGGFVMGLLMLFGYLNVTKVQTEEYEKSTNLFELNQINSDNSDNVDLDLMMERLEKLQEIKDLGGLTDEEYENLRRSIIEGKK